jgi:glycogen debranching enzyme
MLMNHDSNTEKLAIEVLKMNWREGYTIPSARLYPFQWNWDSGFIALGLAYIDPKQAMEEIRFMYKGQWENGMLPHINFHQHNDKYFPGPLEWGTEQATGKDCTIPVSGITQPAVFGFILEKMHHLLQDKVTDWMAFLEEVVPKIIKQHRHFYTCRDPKKEGLVYIEHNWESGTDNSPMWDEIFEKMDITHARDVSALRQDNKKVGAEERPTDENYKRYMYIVDLLRTCNYDDQLIAEKCPFLVQDVLFNSILVKSNDSLIRFGNLLGIDVSDIVFWNNKAKAAINSKFWDEETGFYYAYDLRNESRIKIKVSSGFAPLFAGIASSLQAERLVNHLTTSFIKHDDWKLCPSCAANEPAFNPLKYWRGPVWININWMLFEALNAYGFTELANRLKRDTMYLMEQHGMYEYFDPRPEQEGGLAKRGIGADYFSWSAALYLDLLHHA